MTFTYDASDVTSGLARIRLLIGDTVSANALFQDEEIAAFLALNDDDVRLAAASALDAMAANQVMILKVITQNGISTDGAAVAQALRAQAAELRRQATIEAQGEDAEDAPWDWAETVGLADSFAYRERLLSQHIRGLL